MSLKTSTSFNPLEGYSIIYGQSKPFALSILACTALVGGGAVYYVNPGDSTSIVLNAAVSSAAYALSEATRGDTNFLVRTPTNNAHSLTRAAILASISGSSTYYLTGSPMVATAAVISNLAALSILSKIYFATFL
jgi:hypothetical protein